MSNPSNSGQVLSGLEDTQITMNSSPQPPINFIPETWEVIEKVGEDTVTQAHRVLAYLSADTLAWNRIAKGFSPSCPGYRASRAPPELQALKHFKQQGCNVVPEILGYQFEKQDMEDIIPGGFVTYVIWKKVPGEPLDFTRFWNCTFSERDIIRDKFRQIYEVFLRFDYQVWVPSSTKIIYDWSTGEMHISGFKDATNRFLGKVWSDDQYAEHGLVLDAPSIRSYFPIESTDLYRDDNGWEW
ncbi:hypothetical protein N7505_005526 [Penicillium chrysogenum]|uniref:Uncharacterized protein n=1 Tax=Penicillium chrysogenum TaxID=5076 RepID=A0ABQ8WI51_PENCH|nr:hypothetical protein N7505_005526 [Penicillium chrysogenum]